MDPLAQAASGSLKQEPPQFDVGDTVDVHVRIREGEKERIQIFTGVVLGIRGSGIARAFTVRRIVAGEGVERVFPIHCPSVVEVNVKKRAKVRRAKLYYLRQRTGKRARMKERHDYGKKKKASKPKPPQEPDATVSAEPTDPVAPAPPEA